MDAFDTTHARHLPEAERLRSRTLLIIGAGAVGSNVARGWVCGGGSVVIVDHDSVEVENLVSGIWSRDQVGQNKALAVQQVLTSVAADGQTVTPIAMNFVADASIAELAALLASQAIDGIVCATGNHAANLRASELGQEMGRPVLIPGIYPLDEVGDTVIGQVLLIPWDVDMTTTACARCLWPGGEDEPEGLRPDLEAQERLVGDEVKIADLTTDLAKAWIAGDRSSETFNWLASNVADDRTCFLLRRDTGERCAVQTRHELHCDLHPRARDLEAEIAELAEQVRAFMGANRRERRGLSRFYRGMIYGALVALAFHGCTSLNSDMVRRDFNSPAHQRTVLNQELTLDEFSLKSSRDPILRHNIELQIDRVKRQLANLPQGR